MPSARKPPRPGPAKPRRRPAAAAPRDGARAEDAARPTLRLLSVASEVFPLVKTGGLADVVGALPAALAEEAVAARTLVPGYPAVLGAIHDADAVCDLSGLFGAGARIVAATAAGLDLLVLDAPQFFDRPGGPYAQPDGGDWPDNGVRFGALARAAALVARGGIDGYRPDVVHCHDWQAGLVPAYLHFSDQPAPPSVATIHNIAFQGQMPPEILGALALPLEAYGVEGVEYYGSIGYLKSAVRLADRVTTVSPTYAREIRTAEFGMGLEGLIQARGRDVSGILNGIDMTVWNPSTDATLAARFGKSTLGRRAPNKPALLARFGLDPESRRPLFAVVSRLTWQKGLDLLAEALPTLLALDADLVMLGSGDPALTQLCALRYGAIPVAARVGGLSDTIIDTNEMARQAGIGTGVLFSPVGREPFEQALARTCELFAMPDVWRRMQSNALRTDVGWGAPARAYADLYRTLVSSPAARST